MSEFDPKNVLKVDIEKVFPNDWNPKKESPEYAKILESLRVNGFVTPITVREKDGSYEIVDGFHRWKAAKELGFKEIYVYNLGEISDKEAKSLTLWYEVQVPFDEIDLAPIVLELDAIGIEIPYSEAEVEKYSELMSFSMEDYSPLGIEKEDDDLDGFETFKVKISEEQYDFVKNKIAQVGEDEMVSEGRALELICADFLSGWEDIE